MFNPRLYENSTPDGFAVLEVTTRPDKARQFVPLKRSELTGEVTGPLAALVLTQVFGYSRDQCDKVLEAAYRFPLPGDAAVTGVVARFGEVEIRAELKEREQAEQEYKEAKRQGKQAALASRESPDVFTLQVTGLQPDQEVRIETTYVQLVKSQGLGFGMRIPLTTAPRYVRSDESGSRHAQGQPLALLRDPGHRFSLDLSFASAISVTSATHALAITEQDGNLNVRLQNGEVLPDRDCELVWLPRQGRDNPTLEVLAHSDADKVYFLAQIIPPANATSAVLPREIVLLVDRSGSMEGPKWQATEFAVKHFLTNLDARDRFNLGLFHNTTRWFAQGQLRADKKAIEAACAFMDSHRDSGGTELGVALEQSLAMPHADGMYARHLLIITDAQVSDEGRILGLAENEQHAADRRRISLLCIDAAPNSFLALELAERGGGVARFLTSAPAEGDIAAALNSILGEWSQPLAVNVSLELDRTPVFASGRLVSAGSVAGGSAVDLGDLPTNRSLWVAGCAPMGQSDSLTVTLTDQSKPLASTTLKLSDGKPRPAVMALYGARQIVELEFLMHSNRPWEEIEKRLVSRGYDALVLSGAGKQPRVYAENEITERRRALRQLLVQEALHYGLACAETSFIAVRQEQGKVIDGTVAVANALPAGWSEEFLSGAPSMAMLSRTRGPAPQMRMPPIAMSCFPSQPADSMGSGSLERLMSDDDIMEDDDGVEPPVFLRRLSALKGRLGSSGASILAQISKAQGAGPRSMEATLFSGQPAFQGKQANLFDKRLPLSPKTSPRGVVVWSWIHVDTSQVSQRPELLKPGLHLLIIIGHSVKADLPLRDLVGQPYDVSTFKLRHHQSDQVVLVLIDDQGAWAAGAPAIEVIVSWLVGKP
ncbi:MAG: VIT domain-containing protein [Anaerolineae bacterium]